MIIKELFKTYMYSYGKIDSRIHSLLKYTVKPIAAWRAFMSAKILLVPQKFNASCKAIAFFKVIIRDSDSFYSFLLLNFFLSRFRLKKIGNYPDSWNSIKYIENTNL